jgi:thiol-disulfide isomerase/thioredoxin
MNRLLSRWAYGFEIVAAIALVAAALPAECGFASARPEEGPQQAPPTQAPPSQPPAQKAPPASQNQQQAPPSAKPATTPGAPTGNPGAAQPGADEPDPEAELQQALQSAGNDRAALVQNLEEYLKKFPNSPRKDAIYHALVDPYIQLRQNAKAIEYAERCVAANPGDTEMTMIAANLLELQGDDGSLQRAIGYVTSVLESVQKASIEEKPARDSEADWIAEKKGAVMTLYLLRGKLEVERHATDAAIADLQASYKTEPNPGAAMKLGELAETQKKSDEAIEQYLLAFVLPSRQGSNVDLEVVSKKLGDLWQASHGSQAGLGERILATYDKVNRPESSSVILPNAGAKDPYAFVLSQPGVTTQLKMADERGKVVVLDFWATWCNVCRESEPMLEQVGKMFARAKDIVFLAVNNDEDRARVAPYLEKQKMSGTVVFADGLDDLFGVRALPTFIVLDRNGKVAYRAEGVDEDTFVASLMRVILQAQKTP